jgi:hypothetical protein
MILLLDAGQTWAVIRDKLDCTDSFIDRWGKRFVQERLAGLFSRHAGQAPTTLTPIVEARILEWGISANPVMDRRIGLREDWERNCMSPR